jgi:tRNA-specific 2-thiouridylase
LAFNARVLQEAADDSVPLLDRLRFLGIFSNNLDEFFRVRFAAIRRLSLSGISGEKYLGGVSAQQLVKEITEIVIEHQAESLNILNEIESQLQKENIYIINENDLDKDQENYLKDFFIQRVSPELVTIILNDLAEFPLLKDTFGYLAVKLVMKKEEEVREIANKAGLPSARRKDSQGICFLGKINYNDFVRRFLGEKEGAIIELETGKKLGTHRGYWFHTIGQRKGLGLSGGPWFVVKKDIEENTIYVSRGYGVETQYGNEFRMHDFHFITDNPWKGQEKEIDITFKIRHTPDFTKGKLIQEGEKQFHILSSEKLQGIAPGQFGVIYDEEAKVCVGSGEIIC